MWREVHRDIREWDPLSLSLGRLVSRSITIYDDTSLILIASMSNLWVFGSFLLEHNVIAYEGPWVWVVVWCFAKIPTYKFCVIIQALFLLHFPSLR